MFSNDVCKIGMMTERFNSDVEGMSSFVLGRKENLTFHYLSNGICWLFPERLKWMAEVDIRGSHYLK